MTTATERVPAGGWRPVDDLRLALAAEAPDARARRLTAALAEGGDVARALALCEAFPSADVARALAALADDAAVAWERPDPLSPWEPLSRRLDRALAASLGEGVARAIELAWRRAADAVVDPSLLVALARLDPERASREAPAWVDRVPSSLAPLLRAAPACAAALLDRARSRALAPHGALALVEPLAHMDPTWLEAHAREVAERSPEALPVTLGALQRAGRSLEATAMALAGEALLDRHLFIQEASYCIGDHALRRRAEQANERAKKRPRKGAKGDAYAAARDLIARQLDECARSMGKTAETITHAWFNDLGPIKTWEPLREFPSLRSLSVYKGKVPDLAPLAALPELGELSLGERCSVASLAPLRACAKLATLSAPGGALAALDGPLPALTILHLDGPTAGDLDAIARHLPALEHLSLSKAAAVEGLAFLAGVALVGLRLDGAGLTSLAGLGCARLASLAVSGSTAFADLSALAEATELSALTLQKTAVADLSALAKGPSLRSLELRESPVTTLAPLASHGRLEHLNAYKAERLDDIAALRGLVWMKVVNLEKTRVRDLSPLDGCAALEELHVAGLKSVRDFSFLRTLRALERVDLGDTRFDAPALLAGLPALTRVRLKGTPLKEGDPSVAALRDALFARGGNVSFSWGW